MSRTARCVIPEQIYHVTQRGNYRQPIFLNNADYAVYLTYLNENAQKFHLDILAFCLMPNHIHLIAKPLNRESLAKTLGVTHMRYAHYFNGKKNFKGHLWQGRFYSCQLLGDHLPTAVRYVVRNPVRAGIVQKPWDFHWSSAQSHLGKKYQVIQLTDLRDYLDITDWKEFLDSDEQEAALEGIRKATRQGKIFGPSVDSNRSLQ